MDTPLNATTDPHQLPAALFETQAIGHGVAQLVSKDNRAPKFLHLPLSGRLLWPQAGPLTEQRRAIFLDRDGVVVEDVHYLRQPAQISLLPGIIDLIRALQGNYFIIIVTNQSGLARGFFTEADLREIHGTLLRQLLAHGAIIDAVYYCPHLPNGQVEAFSRECDCRKPNPGMLTQSAADWQLNLGQSFLIGDSDRDIQAGHAAGVPGVWLNHHRQPGNGAFATVSTLAEAAAVILEQRRPVAAVAKA